MSKDFFDNVDPNILTSFGDIMVYDNQFVEPLESDMTAAKLTIADNTARIATLEQQIPGGGTGKGAYLNLGGTPERYPNVDECVGQGTDETGFLVVAKPDGIYFYNPVTKTFIPPKKGGGNVAIQGQFPDVFDDSHSIKHAGKITRSGVFLADYREIGITAWTYPEYACQLMVTSHESGAEQHVVIGKEGLAYKIFLPGQDNAEWVHYQGTPGGGGGGGAPLPFPFVDLTDTPDTYAGMGGKVLAVNTTENGIEFIDAPTGGGGTPVDFPETFLELLDTPASYTGHRGRMVVVNDTETALTYVDRDASIVDQVFNAFKIGQPVIDSKSVSGGALVSDQTVMQADLSENQLLVMTGTSARTANLPEIAPRDTDTIMNSQTRAGRLYYIHNQTDVTKRFRPSPGDVFMIEGAEVTTSQNLVGKSTAILYPAHNGTKGVWYILSLDKITSPGGGPKDRFLDLDDTPTAYTGNESKILAVTAAGDGIEFADAPAAGMAEAEVEALIQSTLGSGSNLIHMNGFGAPVSQSSNDRPQNVIAQTPYIMMSGNTVKTCTMPNIVAHTATTLAANEVRAGRVTYIINQSATHNKNVDVPSGHNFFVDGATITTRQIVPPLSVKIFYPGIWGNGNKNWAYIGGFSTVPGNVRETGLMDGSHRYSAKGLVRSSWATGGATFTQANVVDSPILVPIATGNQTINMPQLVEKDTASPTTSQMRCGQRVTIFNHSAVEKTLVWHSGQGIIINGSKSTADYKIQPRFVEEFVGFKSGTEYIWICISSKKADGQAGSGGVSATDQEFLTGIQNGDKYLHANAMVTPASVIASSTFTAEQAATTNNLIIRTTTGATTGTMPSIVSVTSTSIPAGSVRLGFEMTISNHNDSSNVTINYQNGSQLWNNGSFGATSSLSPNSWIKLVAVNTSGGTYGWAKVASGTH